jgi:hypothetical protein
VAELQDEPLSNDEMAEIIDMVECTRPAQFILWEDEDQAQAKISDSGVPLWYRTPTSGGNARLGGLRTMHQAPYPEMRIVRRSQIKTQRPGGQALTNRADTADQRGKA